MIELSKYDVFALVVLIAALAYAAYFAGGEG